MGRAFSSGSALLLFSVRLFAALSAVFAHPPQLALLVCGCASAARSEYYYEILDAVMTREDLYETLGVQPQAELADIKRAYRTLALKWHPDKQQDAKSRAKASTVYTTLTKAYRILSSAEGREEYDLMRKHGLRDVPLMDKHYYRHAHRYGIPPHDPRWVFLSLLALFTLLKYVGQLLTFKYYMRIATSHPRYKEWARTHGDAGGERLKLIGVKRPGWDSLLAVQVALLPWQLFRLLRWLFLRCVLRRPEPQVDYFDRLKERLELTDEEVDQLRAKAERTRAEAPRRRR